MSLLLSDNSYLPDLSKDLTNISRLGSAIDVLITCKKSNTQFALVPDTLQNEVKEGLDLGVSEVDKLEILLNKFLSRQLEESERIYFSKLLTIFPYLSGNNLLSKNVIENNVDEVDRGLYSNRLKEIKDKFVEYNSSKLIKDFQFQENRLDSMVTSISNYLYTDYFQTVNSIEEFSDFY